MIQSYAEWARAVPPWLKKTCSGVDRPELRSVVMEGDRFAIIRTEGHQYQRGYASRGYSPTTYALIEKGAFIAHSTTVWTGRLSREGRRHIKAALQDAEGRV